MKKKISFVPQGDAGRDLWLKNFANKLPQYAAKYNINAADQTDISKSSAFYSYWLNYNNQLEEYNRKLRRYKNELRDGIEQGATPSILPAFPSPGAPPATVLPGIFDRAVSIANRIKKHIAYTSADGLDMGIESPVAAPVTDFENMQPVLKLRLVGGGQVEVMWTRKNMDSVEIHVDHGEGYEFLSFDSHPNFTDPYSLEPGETGVWHYKAIYIKNDKRVGLWSEDYSITVTGKAAA